MFLRSLFLIVVTKAFNPLGVEFYSAHSRAFHEPFWSILGSASAKVSTRIL